MNSAALQGVLQRISFFLALIAGGSGAHASPAWPGSGSVDDQPPSLPFAATTPAGDLHAEIAALTNTGRELRFARSALTLIRDEPNDVFARYVSVLAQVLEKHGDVHSTTDLGGALAVARVEFMAETHDEASALALTRLACAEILGLGAEIERIGHRDILPLLAKDERLRSRVRDAEVELARYFGEDARLTLGARVDHDEGDEYLLLRVHTALSAPDAFARRDAFDENWWLERAGSSDGLIIDFERV